MDESDDEDWLRELLGLTDRPTSAAKHDDRPTGSQQLQASPTGLQQLQASGNPQSAPGPWPVLIHFLVRLFAMQPDPFASCSRHNPRFHVSAAADAVVPRQLSYAYDVAQNFSGTTSGFSELLESLGA